MVGATLFNKLDFYVRANILGTGNDDWQRNAEGNNNSILHYCRYFVLVKFELLIMNKGIGYLFLLKFKL